jgi:hypothetical protein
MGAGPRLRTRALTLLPTGLPAGPCTPPVLSGDYRNLKYAKTGLIPAMMRAPREAPLH